MTAPRRSGGDRHCKSALSGTKSNPLKIPRRRHDDDRAEKARADRGKGERIEGQTERPQGKQPVFDLRDRQLAGQPAAQADADPQRRQRKTALRVCQLKVRRVVSEDHRRHERGDCPNEDLADQGQSQNPIGADRFVCEAHRRFEPALASRSLDRGDRRTTPAGQTPTNRPGSRRPPTYACPPSRESTRPPRSRPASPGLRSFPGARCPPTTARPVRSRARFHTSPARKTRSELRSSPARRSTSSRHRVARTRPPHQRASIRARPPSWR